MSTRKTGKIPAWSGEFWKTADGERAVMRIHNDDRRHHRPSEDGWVLIDIIEDDEQDAENYVYARRQH